MVVAFLMLVGRTWKFHSTKFKAIFPWTCWSRMFKWDWRWLACRNFPFWFGLELVCIDGDLMVDNLVRNNLETPRRSSNGFQSNFDIISETLAEIWLPWVVKVIKPSYVFAIYKCLFLVTGCKAGSYWSRKLAGLFNKF